MALYWPEGRIALEFVEEVPEGGPYPPDTLVLTAPAAQAHDAEFADDVRNIVFQRVLRCTPACWEEAMTVRRTGGAETGTSETGGGADAEERDDAGTGSEVERAEAAFVRAYDVAGGAAGGTLGSVAGDAGLPDGRAACDVGDDYCAEMLDELIWSAERSRDLPRAIFHNCGKIVIGR